MSLIVAIFILAEGVFVGWFLAWLHYADRAGRFYLPESLHERSGWIHDGTLYVASDERLYPHANKEALQ